MFGKLETVGGDLYRRNERRPWEVWKPKRVHLYRDHAESVLSQYRYYQTLGCNFFSSDAYLGAVASVYFPGREARAEKFTVGDDNFRLLVIDGRAITKCPFLDYHTPAPGAHRRTGLYLGSVAKDSVAVTGPAPTVFDGSPAPYINWTRVASWEAYQELLKTRAKGLMADAARRRRQLERDLGQLTFTVHDDSDEAIEKGFAWKRDQFANNHIFDEKGLQFFYELRRRGVLVASTLRANGRLLAVWLGYIHEAAWSGWIFSHDPGEALKKYSTGRQLLHSMLEESYRRKHWQFDFSIGGEPYKWMYATHYRVCGPIGPPPLTKRIKQVVKRYPRIDAIIRASLSFGGISHG